MGGRDNVGVWARVGARTPHSDTREAWVGRGGPPTTAAKTHGPRLDYDGTLARYISGRGGGYSFLLGFLNILYQHYKEYITIITINIY